MCSVANFHVYKVCRINFIYGSTLYSQENRGNGSDQNIVKGDFFGCPIDHNFKDFENKKVKSMGKKKLKYYAYIHS